MDLFWDFLICTTDPVYLKNKIKKKKPLPWPGGLSWLEHHSVHEKVAGSIPSQAHT